MEIVVTGDDSKTLFNPQYKETYHSKFGAVTESRTIFIEGSDLAAACLRKNRQPTNKHKREQPEQDKKVRVLEIGFGLGLNFLLSADLAKSMNSELDYLAIEQDLLPVNTLQQLDYHQQLKHPEIANTLYKQLSEQLSDQPGPPAGPSRKLGIMPGINLYLFEQMTALTSISTQSIDAIYLDAFSPDCNPECWTPEILKLLAGLLSPQGTLLTYSAKGIVRRSLLAAGLQVQRLPGPPGKREFIKAEPASSYNPN